MAEPENVNQYSSLPRVGVVQNIGDVSVVRGSQTLHTPQSLRIPSRDAFLALHRQVLRISSSVELSVSSKASSQDTLNEPSTVAGYRWSERFEEAFKSETSLATVKIDEEEEENEEQRDANGTDEALSTTKSNRRSLPCTPLIISPDCASITSASCPSITSGSITGFEFPAVNSTSDRATLDSNLTTNGNNTLSVMHMEHQGGNQESKNDFCCVATGCGNDKHNSNKMKCVCIVFALLTVILIPFLVSHLLYNYGRSKKGVCSRRGYQIVSIVYCSLTYLLLFILCTIVVLVFSCDCIL